MKTRILGSLLVLLILATLYILTGGDRQLTPSASIQSQPGLPSSSDNDLKNLKIN